MTIYTIIGIMCLGIGLFVVSVFFIFGKRNAKNLSLIGLLVIILLNLIYALVIHTQLISTVPALYFLFNKGYFFHLLLYPFFLLFIQSYTQKSIFKIWFGLLLLPPLLIFGYSLIQFVGADPLYIQDRVTQFLNDSRPGPEHIFYSWFLITIKVLVPAFVIVIATYEVRNFFKEGVLKKTKRLLSSICLLLILIVVFRLFSFPLQRLLFLYSGDSFAEWTVEIIFSSLFILVLSFLLIVQYSLDQLGEIRINGESYAASSLTNERLQKLLNSIKELVIDQKYYQVQGFTITDLSEELGVNSKYLSEAINRILGQSFPDFLNACRIEKAKDLLKNDAYKHYSIEAIASEAGFNSRSTFYRVFKNEVGVSPTEFKDNKR